MNKPNLFIPGFPKSGTTALHKALVQNTFISDGGVKEPHVYSWNVKYKKRNIFFNKRYKDINGNVKYIIDSSTSYMVSDNAIGRIIKDTPNSKFIIIARDPIDRIVSHYNWLSSKSLIELPAEQEIKKHLKEKFNYRKHYDGNYKSYLDFSLYGQKTENLLKIVNEKNFLFLTYEDLFQKKDLSKKIIGDFLNIDLDDIKFLIANKTNFNHRSKNKTVFKNLKIWLLNHYRYLTGWPRPIKVSNPIKYYTNRDEIEEFLLPHLIEDIKILENLGFDLSSWKSYDKINK